MSGRLIAPLLAAALAGCATAAQPPADPPVFGRVDCQIITGNAALERQLEQSKEICLARSQAAGISGSAAIPVGRGIDAAIASGIERGVTQHQIAHATQVSCMAEQGYLIRTRTEHAEACSTLRPAPRRK